VKCKSVRESASLVSVSQSVVVSLSVGELDSRLGLELDLENQFVRECKRMEKMINNDSNNRTMSSSSLMSTN